MSQMAVVEGQPWHCGQMARVLRRSHRALLERMEVPVHREIRNSFDASMWRKSLMVDGRLAAMAGICGSVSSADGVIWLALAEDIGTRPAMIARIALRFLDEIMRVKRRLTTIVLKEDRRGLLFAYFLGFRVETTTMINGAYALVMEYDRPSRMVA